MQEELRALRVNIAHTKLDLEERLNKRRQKQERRRMLAEAVVCKLCGALQLAALGHPLPACQAPGGSAPHVRCVTEGECGVAGRVWCGREQVALA